MPDFNVFICVPLFFYPYCTEIVQKPNSLYVFFFAPADRMIMNYFVPVCPLLPASADAAVLRMSDLVSQRASFHFLQILSDVYVLLV